MDKVTIFVILAGLIMDTASNYIYNNINNNQYKKNNQVNVVSQAPAFKNQIPDSWMTFIPKKLPFVPFSGIDYFEMYKTPVDVSLYAGAGRAYNPNYKPYYPEKYLYATDYSYNRFIKETKIKGSKNDNKYEYNHWLWKKIRSDFKRVHGMYSATITDKYGIKHKITWEDGGTVSIYEQYKLFYEYAIMQDFTKTNYYKFLKNFRNNYPDVRVNSPFIEFAEPHTQNFFDSNINVYLYDNTHRYKYTVSYDPNFQIEQHDGGVLLKKTQTESSHLFMGPDGKQYRAYWSPGGYDISEADSIANTNAEWVKKTEQKIKAQHDLEDKKEKLNVFLYYEIYDAFCRKYGYTYDFDSYENTIPSKVNVKYEGANYNQDEYNNFYNKYKDYITGSKSPSSEYLSAKAKLEERNIKVEIIPEKKETHYFRYLKVNASDKQKTIEVENVYKQKKYKVKPQPYSVTKTVSYYKKLNKTDIRMILEHLKDRLSIIRISENATSYGKKILTDKEIEDIYLLYEYQPEKFREYAPELDKKYAQYYPQNIK